MQKEDFLLIYVKQSLINPNIMKTHARKHSFLIVCVHLLDVIITQ